MAGQTRIIERTILNYVFWFMILGFAAIVSAGILRDIITPLIMIGVTILAFLFTHYVLQWRKFEGDMFLLPMAGMLNVCGLLAVMRVSPEFASKQFLWLFVGLAVYLATVLILKRYALLEDYKYIIMIIGILLLLSPVIFGIQVGGARSWLEFNGFRFQPSEIVKIVLVIFLASYLDKNREQLREGIARKSGFIIPKLQYFGPLLVMWGISLILLVFQRDLGTALIFFGTFLAMVYMATGRISYVLLGLLLFILGAGSCYFLFNHVRVRIDIWLNPWADPNGKGYQIVQSLMAIASGGIFGAGLGQGDPNLIPAVHTDFIFSALAEELGLLGSIAIVLIYCIMIYRGFRIAFKAKTGFGALLAAGLTSLLALQTLIILGGVTKLVPLTGVTLPFISYGGSSLVSSYFLLGILANISVEEGTSL